MKGNRGSYGFTELTRIGAGLDSPANQTAADALDNQLAELVDYLFER
jgi:hypothetical protein